MKKRVIKNLSVLLCAAMLAGSLGYGTIAAEPESDVVSEEQAEVESETVGMKTASTGDEIVGAVDGISDEPKGDEKDDLETDNSSAQEGDESEEPEESLKLLGGAAPATSGWDDDHEYYYKISDTGVIECRYKQLDRDIFGWVDKDGKEHWFTKENVYRGEKYENGEYVDNGLYFYSYSSYYGSHNFKPVNDIIANCNYILQVTNGTITSFEYGRYVKDSSFNNDSGTLLYPDTNSYGTSGSFKRDCVNSDWKGLYPIVANVDMDNKATVEFNSGEKLKVYCGDAYSPKTEGDEDPEHPTKNGNYEYLGKVYFVGNSANIHNAGFWYSEEKMKENTDVPYNWKNYDAVEYIKAPTPDSGYTIRKIDGELYEYSNSPKLKKCKDKNNKYFCISVYTLKKWDDSTSKWGEGVQCALNLSDSAVIPIPVDNLGNYTFAELSNYNGCSEIPEGFYFSGDPEDSYLYKENSDKFISIDGYFPKITFYEVRTFSAYSINDLSKPAIDYYHYIGEFVTDASGDTCVLPQKGDYNSPRDRVDLNPDDYDKYGIAKLTEEQARSKGLYTAKNYSDESYYLYRTTETRTLGKYTIRYNLFEAYDKDGNEKGKAIGRPWDPRDMRYGLRTFTQLRWEGFIADEFLADMETMEPDEFTMKYYEEIDEYMNMSVDPVNFISQSDNYKLLMAYPMVMEGNGFSCTVSLGMLYDKVNGGMIEGFYKLDKDGFLSDDVYDAEEASGFIGSHTKTQCDTEFTGFYGYSSFTGKLDPTKYGYERYNEWYYIKELPDETLTVYGEDYKVTFNKIYSLIEEEYILFENPVVHYVKCTDEDTDRPGHDAVWSVMDDLAELPSIAAWKSEYDLADETAVFNKIKKIYPDAVCEKITKTDIPDVDDTYTHVTGRNSGNEPVEAYYKKTDVARFDFKDGYIEIPIYSGYWKNAGATGNSWIKFENASLSIAKEGENTYFSILSRDYLMDTMGMQFEYICSMDAMVEEMGVPLETYLIDGMGYVGIKVVRYSQIPSGDDIIKIDDKSYYKLKSSDGLFKKFSDGELYGPVYTKFTLANNQKFIEDPSTLYLAKADDTGKVTVAIPSTISGSYANACKQYGDLEQMFGCKFKKKSTPTPKPHDDDEDEPSHESSGQNKGPAPVENSGQMKGTGSQNGWKSIEASISPKNEVNGTYTIWGSKTMDVPSSVMSKMQSTGVNIANFAMTPKTLFSMWPSLNRDGFSLSIDARCWNDNIKYHDFAPSVPAATILAKGGNVLSDVLTVRCSNKDVNKTAVITNNKLLPNTVSATLYVYNPGNNTLVPYKTARYGHNGAVQFIVPCVSATYVCIEN